MDAVVIEEFELPEEEAPPAPRIMMSLFVLAFWTVFAYAIPVIAAYNSPIDGVIFGFALWEAWKLNRRLVLVFNGPFRLGSVGPDDATSLEVVDDGA